MMCFPLGSGDPSYVQRVANPLPLSLERSEFLIQAGDTHLRTGIKSSLTADDMFPLSGQATRAT